MAEVKTAVTATAKPVAKATVATKTAEAKTETKAVAAKAETKAAAKKGAPKKAAAKKAETKAVAEKTQDKKSEVKVTVDFQFSGKSYTVEDLVKIAKDVWKYDLGKKSADIKSIELYVKPEENQAYYVINGEVTGNFGI